MKSKSILYGSLFKVKSINKFLQNIIVDSITCGTKQFFRDQLNRCKAIDSGIGMDEIKRLEEHDGKSGDWVAD